MSGREFESTTSKLFGSIQIPEHTCYRLRISSTRENNLAPAMERSRAGIRDAVDRRACGGRLTVGDSQVRAARTSGLLVVTVVVLLTYLGSVQWIERRPARRVQLLEGAWREMLTGLDDRLRALRLGDGHPVDQPASTIQREQARAKGIATGLALAIMSGVFEEILFRGILFRASSRIVGTWGALLFTASIFGLAHLAKQGSDSQQWRRHHARSRNTAGCGLRCRLAGSGCPSACTSRGTLPKARSLACLCQAIRSQAWAIPGCCGEL